MSRLLRAFGTHDENTLDQMVAAINSDERVAAGVLCADGHLGYGVPIGGVLAVRDAVSPQAVGYDIACGNMAVKLDMKGTFIKPLISEAMDEIWNNISFGVGRKNQEEVYDPYFEHVVWENHPVLASVKDLAISQLGTVGSGNHFVDLFVDQNNDVWVGVHFGSRGMGHRIASHYIKAAGGRDGVNATPTFLSTNSDLGKEYLEAMTFAGWYAAAGRAWVCSKVASLLGTRIVKKVHNNHNFAWKEEHNGEELWVVRKGSTRLYPGVESFIGGSMGDVSVIVEGVDSPTSKEALYSTVHGAGRVMSRNEAAGKVKYKSGQRVRVSEGKISREMMMDWVTEAGVELRGAGTDESPHCYRRLPDVLAAHEGTFQLNYTLQPIGVAMAGANEFDPYKD